VTNISNTGDIDMSIIKFTEAKLSNTGKKGILTPDEHGYYEHVIGGLNTLNSADEYYVADGVTQLFEQSSLFIRRIKNGCLKGELGHPKQAPGMGMKTYMRRIMSIEETNVCVHYADVFLDPNYGKKNPQLRNPHLVAIIAKLKPSGPKAQSLKDSLDNPKENVCFSIRALTKDRMIRGTNYRTIVQIVTWDCVTEPGIAISNKWDSPAMETLSDSPITIKQLEKLANDNEMPLAIESKDLVNESLRLVNIAMRPVQAPKFAKW